MKVPILGRDGRERLVAFDRPPTEADLHEVAATFPTLTDPTPVEASSGGDLVALAPAMESGYPPRSRPAKPRPERTLEALVKQQRFLYWVYQQRRRAIESDQPSPWRHYTEEKLFSDIAALGREIDSRWPSILQRGETTTGPVHGKVRDIPYQGPPRGGPPPAAQKPPVQKPPPRVREDRPTPPYGPPVREARRQAPPAARNSPSPRRTPPPEAGGKTSVKPPIGPPIVPGATGIQANGSEPESVVPIGGVAPSSADAGSQEPDGVLALVSAKARRAELATRLKAVEKALATLPPDRRHAAATQESFDLQRRLDVLDARLRRLKGLPPLPTPQERASLHEGEGDPYALAREWAATAGREGLGFLRNLGKAFGDADSPYSPEERRRASHELPGSFRRGVTGPILSAPGTATRTASNALSSGLGNGPVPESVYENDVASRVSNHVSDYAVYAIPVVGQALAVAQGADVAANVAQNGPVRTAQELYGAVNPWAAKTPEEFWLRLAGLAMGAKHLHTKGVGAWKGAVERVAAEHGHRLPAGWEAKVQRVAARAAERSSPGPEAGFRPISARTLAAMREVVRRSPSLAEAAERIRRRWKLRPQQAGQVARRLSDEGGRPSAPKRLTTEFELSAIPETTTSPSLGVLEPMKPHLDLPADTTPAQFRSIVRNYDREVLAVFDPKTQRLTHAPIVGEESSVNWMAFEDDLHGKLLIHNHPTGKLFSPSDLGTCYWTQLAEIQATSPSGEYFSLKPTEGRWTEKVRVGKAVNDAARAYKAWCDGFGGTLPPPKIRREMYNQLFREAIAGKPVQLLELRDEP